MGLPVGKKNNWLVHSRECEVSFQHSQYKRHKNHFLYNRQEDKFYYCRDQNHQ